MASAAQVSASNAREQLLAVLLMLIGGITWGFVIATLLNIANTYDPSAIEFRYSLDELNRFMQQHLFPDEMRRQLREYMHETKAISVMRTQRQLLTLLSPQLLEDVTLRAYVHGSPLEHLRFCRGAEPAFLAQASLLMFPLIYPPTENVQLGSLHILERGKVTFRGQVLAKGSVWGEDCFLSNPRLRLNAQARAITFVEVRSISGEAMIACARDGGYIKAHQLLRRHILLLALRRELVRAAAERKARERNAKRTSEERRELCDQAQQATTAAAATAPAGGRKASVFGFLPGVKAKQTCADTGGVGARNGGRRRSHMLGGQACTLPGAGATGGGNSAPVTRSNSPAIARPPTRGSPTTQRPAGRESPAAAAVLQSPTAVAALKSADFSASEAREALEAISKNLEAQQQQIRALALRLESGSQLAC